jgi:hypothetical protein
MLKIKHMAKIKHIPKNKTHTKKSNIYQKI